MVDSIYTAFLHGGNRRLSGQIVVLSVFAYIFSTFMNLKMIGCIVHLAIFITSSEMSRMLFVI